jgi:hypothetical protein
VVDIHHRQLSCIHIITRSGGAIREESGVVDLHIATIGINSAAPHGINIEINTGGSGIALESAGVDLHVGTFAISVRHGINSSAVPAINGGIALECGVVDLQSCFLSINSSTRVASVALEDGVMNLHIAIAALAESLGTTESSNSTASATRRIAYEVAMPVPIVASSIGVEG